MEATILATEQFKVVENDLKEIKAYVKKITSPSEHFIDNKEFVKLMGISFRTAQTWRDEGKIGFLQEGKKIYYRMSDIDLFLENHHHKPFHPIRKAI